MGQVYECRYGNLKLNGSNTSSDTSIDSDATTIECTGHRLYRGNDLGVVTPDTIDSFITSHGISSGSFTDLYVGDHFCTDTITVNGQTISQYNLIVLDIDPYYNISESNLYKTHHILALLDIACVEYFSKYDNSNGYKKIYNNSIMRTADLALDVTLGDHLLSYNEIISTDNSTGTEIASVKTIFMNEMEVFGKQIYSNNISGYINYQLPAFTQNSDLKIATYNGDAYSWWLRDCCGASGFCCVDTNGNPSYSDLNDTTASYARFVIG
jgi:hypothetical protein